MHLLVGRHFTPWNSYNRTFFCLKARSPDLSTTPGTTLYLHYLMMRWNNFINIGKVSIRNITVGKNFVTPGLAPYLS